MDLERTRLDGVLGSTESGFCERGDESSGPIHCGEFMGPISHYQLHFLESQIVDTVTRESGSYLAQLRNRCK
jgi:hypothetical protein